MGFVRASIFASIEGAAAFALAEADAAAVELAGVAFEPELLLREQATAARANGRTTIPMFLVIGALILDPLADVFDNTRTSIKVDSSRARRAGKRLRVPARGRMRSARAMEVEDVAEARTEAVGGRATRSAREHELARSLVHVQP